MPVSVLELLQRATDRFNTGDLDGFAGREIATIKAFFDHDEAMNALA